MAPPTVTGATAQGFQGLASGKSAADKFLRAELSKQPDTMSATAFARESMGRVHMGMDVELARSAREIKDSLNALDTTGKLNKAFDIARDTQGDLAKDPSLALPAFVNVVTQVRAIKAENPKDAALQTQCDSVERQLQSHMRMATWIGTANLAPNKELAETPTEFASQYDRKCQKLAAAAKGTPFDGAFHDTTPQMNTAKQMAVVGRAAEKMDASSDLLARRDALLERLNRETKQQEETLAALKDEMSMLEGKIPGATGNERSGLEARLNGVKRVHDRVALTTEKTQKECAERADALRSSPAPCANPVKAKTGAEATKSMLLEGACYAAERASNKFQATMPKAARYSVTDAVERVNVRAEEIGLGNTRPKKDFHIPADALTETVKDHKSDEATTKVLKSVQEPVDRINERLDRLHELEKQLAHPGSDTELVNGKSVKTACAEEHERLLNEIDEDIDEVSKRLNDPSCAQLLETAMDSTHHDKARAELIAMTKALQEADQAVRNQKPGIKRDRIPTLTGDGVISVQTLEQGCKLTHKVKTPWTKHSKLMRTRTETMTRDNGKEFNPSQKELRAFIAEYNKDLPERHAKWVQGGRKGPEPKKITVSEKNGKITKIHCGNIERKDQFMQFMLGRQNELDRKAAAGTSMKTGTVPQQPSATPQSITPTAATGATGGAQPPTMRTPLGLGRGN